MNDREWYALFMVTVISRMMNCQQSSVCEIKKKEPMQKAIAFDQ